jgi:hypothetical protein
MVDLYNWVDAEAMANLEARIAVDTFASGKMNDARLKVQVGAPLRVATVAVRPARSPQSNAARLLCHKHCCAPLQQCGTCCRYRKG